MSWSDEERSSLAGASGKKSLEKQEGRVSRKK